MRFTEESRDDHLSLTLVSDPIPEHRRIGPIPAFGGRSSN